MQPSFIDVIKDGLPTYELRRGGDRALRIALQRTAASCLNRGWSYHQWSDEVQRPGAKLGEQARLKGGKPLGPVAYQKRLTEAWKSAEQFLADRPAPWTKEQAQAAAHTLADEVETWAIDPDAILNDTERQIIVHATQIARKHRTVNPALPRDATAKALELSQRAVRKALADLVTKGVLGIATRGSQGAGARRATCFRLPDRERRDRYTRGNGCIGQSGQVYRPAGADGQANEARCIGQRPAHDDPTEGGRVRIRVEITTDDLADIEKIQRSLDALATQTSARVQSEERLPADVTSLSEYREEYGA